VRLFARCAPAPSGEERRGRTTTLHRVDHLIRVTDEVEAALEDGRAVVALETTLVAHGFPAPTGIEVGLASEAAVRDAGAVPATIGVLDGRVVIGLTAAELERFSPDARKLGPRDLAPCAVQDAIGATTVGGTLAAAAAVGIRFMGTGGLGGVHRGFPTPPDVSADLGVCARVPALIASSGVKSLLDVPATAEVLETLGIPVLGYRVDTLPLFYAAEGGPRVSARVETTEEAAAVADAHWRLGGNGLLVGRPPDESLDVAALTEEILAEANERGIVGQEVTPFVLAALHERSGGETRRVNRDLIVANAGLAGEIAAAHAAL
jgi:pseudouridine-5'-phosphate glycosidase